MIIDCIHHFGESITKCIDKVVLLPIGSLEYHGSYLPLAVDTLIADRLIRKYLKEGAIKEVIDSSEKCLILLPPLYYGYSPEWINYEGTISLDRELFQRLIVYIYLSTSNINGFKGLIIVNGHGGNTSLLEAVARDITYNYGGRIGIIDIWKIASKLGLKYCHACPFEIELARALGINTTGRGALSKAHLRTIIEEGIYLYNRKGTLGYEGILPKLDLFIKEFYTSMNKLLSIFLDDDKNKH